MTDLDPLSPSSVLIDLQKEFSMTSNNSTRYTTMNKAARTTVAKETINHLVPSVLSSNPRAQKGVQNSQLFRGRTDLPKLISSDDGQAQLESAAAPNPPLPVQLVQNDTLDAARELHFQHPKARIAVLNMASPLQPGGGVLRGAKAQEESLCMRSTLYPSLRPEWYRHPRDAVIYTPDVLVFRSADMKMLEAKDRFYVDVISCAAPRHPQVRGGKDGTNVCYADAQDEEMMTLKVKFIMRTAARMGVTHLILGALGCGAYRNPIGQVANIMRKCLVGKGSDRPAEEDWRGAGIEQVVFAILDDSPAKVVWRAFADEFKDYASVATE
jgi:uncharacterized protein (TIGR02452 family)